VTDGVWNILKPPGMTSHDVVSFARRVLGEKRIGHMGTLDPAAAGVLPVAAGKATRLIEFTDDFDKAYRAEILFGIKTDTGDDTGAIIAEEDCTAPATVDIENCLSSFIGEREQIVPMYSAVKKDGKKLYEFAREGIDVAPITRKAIFFDIRLISRTDTRLIIDVSCSKGVYIRTLCEDIGRFFGYPSTMSLLTRTRVGPFRLEDASTLEEFEASPTGCRQRPAIIMLHYDTMLLSQEALVALRQGKQLPISVYSKADEIESLTRYRLLDESGSFWGVVDADPILQRIVPYKMMEKPL
jgi:tRNA pseudouridine55 synthase